ncbi:MAG: relaxase/mobilization nuclease domain-containing protein [Bdellovibrionales bacterium]|nr:relaxase/mobilization nuclease domain-containing protein [Bdellovibrionales bacterium]
MRTLEGYDKYNAKDRDAEQLETGPEGLEGHMASSIRDEHARFPRKNVQNLAYTIYQSWHEKESGMYDMEKYNQMGRELAEGWAPGHLAWVTTHTDKAHLHNHIVICSVHSETGKMLDPRFKDIARLHEVNNAIAKENGLSLNLPRAKNIEAKLPNKVRQMVSKGKKSWYFDMTGKIDYARAASTSFDEFVGVLGTIGVQARVEEKNISYLYGDHTKAVRGKTMGTNFDKDGLMKAFKENDERFAKIPGLRGQFISDIRTAFDGKGNPLGTPSDLLVASRSHPDLGKKDYGKYTKICRRSDHSDYGAIFDECSGPLAGEMKKALGVSIFDYCKENKIQLSKNEKGRTVLRGKEFVEILSSAEFKNTKNGAQGTVIDFARLHQEATYLGAVAKLNNNPKLLILEQHLGEYKREFQSFYFPKPKPAVPHEAKKALQALLSSRGMPKDGAETLLKSDRVHVGQDLSIWLLGEKSESAMEFREEPDGKWRGKRHGKPTGAFFEQVGRAKQVTVFRDPFHFLLAPGKGAASRHGRPSMFVMFDEGSTRRLKEFMAINPHISEIHLAHSLIPEEREKERSNAHEMKTRFNPFDIHIREMSSAHDKGKGRGPDFGL